jgi:hypothetical protein
MPSGIADVVTPIADVCQDLDLATVAQLLYVSIANCSILVP